MDSPSDATRHKRRQEPLKVYLDMNIWIGYATSLPDRCRKLGDVQGTLYV